ncbi:unnamed protein product [Brachionus calyciflorus]|uniref:Reverse transcriptase domain-containing protein n=1 Tax=Brachionus calyciflorus TaxID=104777 RepID=A0A813Z3B8_9BILA|nr:unnamed protein product [Brachionus calyciflorus]
MLNSDNIVVTAQIQESFPSEPEDNDDELDRLAAIRDSKMNVTQEQIQAMISIAVAAGLQAAGQAQSNVAPNITVNLPPRPTMSRAATALKDESLNCEPMINYIRNNRAKAKHLSTRDNYDIDFILNFWPQFEHVEAAGQALLRERVIMCYYLVAQGWSAAVQALNISKTESTALPPLMSNNNHLPSNRRNFNSNYSNSNNSNSNYNNNNNNSNRTGRQRQRSKSKKRDKNFYNNSFLINNFLNLYYNFCNFSIFFQNKFCKYYLLSSLEYNQFLSYSPLKLKNLINLNPWVCFIHDPRDPRRNIPFVDWPVPLLRAVIADEVFQDNEGLLNHWILGDPDVRSVYSSDADEDSIHSPPHQPPVRPEIVYIEDDDSLPYESPSSGSEHVPSSYPSSVSSFPPTLRHRSPSISPPPTPRRRTPSPPTPIFSTGNIVRPSVSHSVPSSGWSTVTSLDSSSSDFSLLEDSPVNFVSRGNIIQDCTVPEDLFFEPRSNIRDFCRVFPLPANLYSKWKDGVKIYLKQKFVKQHTPSMDTYSEFHERVVQHLASKKILEPCSNKGFYTGMFCVPKDKTSFRPIFNFKKLSALLTTPKFMLPSIYQILQKQNWPSNLFWVKIDIKQAFFNININRNSRYILTIKVNGKYYRFLVLPFGIGIAPFVCQHMLNAILRYIRKFTPFTWGHIDDIIIGHYDTDFLTSIINDVIRKLTKVGWMYNQVKSVIVPTTNLKFLGCFWTPEFVFRSVEVTHRMKQAFIRIYKGAVGKSL